MAQLPPLILLVSLLTVALLISEAVSTTNFTIENQCDYTVWPGITTNSGDQFPTTGFALEKGESRTLTAPTSWVGRFWGRTLCTRNSAGNFSCLTGDCGSGDLECSGNGPTQPSTLAEFSLGQFNGPDFYDVSFIDGYNLPILVIPRGVTGDTCTNAGCVVDINGVCPPELKVKGPDGSQVISCNNACQAFGEPEYCCTGAYSTPETCKASSYSQLFKSVCPTAYSSPFEDRTSTFTCASSADYRITFCPSTNTTSQGNIIPGMSISGNQTLTSSIGTFALGFFSPQNSAKYFLGIWYNTIPNKPIIWVANRYSPLDSPGVFMLGSDGNLVVLDATKEVLVWSSNASVSDAPKNATTGLLNDNGNLVLRFFYWSKLNLTFVEDTLWQSFDHPIDTLLPGMKLSLNKRTAQQRRLTSWAALDDPQPGNFSLGIDPKAHGQAVIWKQNAPYWRSDLYVIKDNHTIFDDDWENAPFSNGTSYFTYNFDADEVYLSFEVTDSSVKLRAMLNPTGQVELLLWQNSSKTWIVLWRKPVDKCDFYARCGPDAVCLKNETLASPCRCLTGFRAKFKEQWDMGNWSSGCVMEKALNCDIGSEGNFSKFERLKVPDHSILLDNKSISECENECHQNCSCTAYAYVNATKLGSSTGRCLTWFGELIDLVENHTLGQNIYIRVYSTDQVGMKKTLVITLISTAVGLLTIIVGYFIWKTTFQKRREHRRKYGKAIAGGGKNDTELPLFGLRSILAATNDFSEANKLGEGGFGPVYKGIFPENQVVAIKRLSKKSGQGHQEFMNELKLIAKLQHTNLVRLLGCCIEEEEMILIYEYMPNRSLDKFLFDPSEKTKLDWGKRFQIIEGIAQGLLYIHKYSRLKIIHRDLKASNILLDGTMNPKISDFGMARIVELNQIEANTNRVVGTYGYMSPEYARYGHFSEKLDVFSFGVLLLEIVSGKKNAAFHRFEHSLTLAGWAWKLWKEGRGVEVIDESVRQTCRSHEALRCIHVGFLCVQEAPANRPTMSSVIHMLGNEATSLLPFKEPAFSTHRNSSAAGPSSQTPNSYSNNTITMSTIHGR